MDKQEYRDFLDEIKRNYDNGNYEQVVMYANEINISKLKDIRTIELISDSYDRLGRYDIARDVLEEVYNRLGGSRQLASRMCELCIKCDDLDTAIDYYDAFRQMAPRDSYQYLLKYQIGKAGGVPVKELIKVLETYREHEKDDKWEYELARLYHEAGRADECVELCDEIVVWFANGEYVKKALELKFMHTALSAKQQALYESMMSHVINNFIPEKNEQSEQSEPEEAAFYKTEGFDDYDRYDELIEAEHGDRYLAPEDYEEIQSAYQSSISAKIASFRETQQKGQGSDAGSSANPNVAVDLTDVRDIESDTRVIPLELLKEKIEQDEEKPRLVRSGEKAQEKAPVQENVQEKKPPVSNLQAIASAHGWGPDQSEKEEAEAPEVTENAEAPEISEPAEPAEIPETAEIAAEAEVPEEAEAAEETEEETEAEEAEETAEAEEVQETIEEPEPEAEIIAEEAAAPVPEPETVDATKVIPSLRFLSERSGKRETIYAETERPAGENRSSNISMEELRKLIRPGEMQNREFGLFFTMEESKQPAEPVAEPAPEAEEIIEEAEQAIEPADGANSSENEGSAAEKAHEEETEYVNIYRASASKIGTLVGSMSPLAQQITRPLLVPENSEEIPAEEPAEGTESSEKADVSEFLMAGESDGQIGINLEALAEDDREMTGQMTLDEVFAEYSKKLEENREQVAAIESERLRLIQEMVNRDAKPSAVFDLDDEEEYTEEPEEAFEEEPVETEEYTEEPEEVYEEESDESAEYTEEPEFIEEAVFEEPEITEEELIADETVIIDEPEITGAEAELVIDEPEAEAAAEEVPEIVIEDVNEEPDDKMISSIASRLFSALEEQEAAAPSETVTRLFEAEDDAAAAAIARFDMQRNPSDAETRKEFTGFIEIEESVLAMLNASEDVDKTPEIEAVAETETVAEAEPEPEQEQEPEPEPEESEEEKFQAIDESEIADAHLTDIHLKSLETEEGAVPEWHDFTEEEAEEEPEEEEESEGEKFQAIDESEIADAHLTEAHLQTLESEEGDVAEWEGINGEEPEEEPEPETEEKEPEPAEGIVPEWHGHYGDSEEEETVSAGSARELSLTDESEEHFEAIDESEMEDIMSPFEKAMAAFELARAKKMAELTAEPEADLLPLELPAEAEEVPEEPKAEENVGEPFEEPEEIQPDEAEQEDVAATADLSETAEALKEETEAEAADKEGFADADEEYERFAPVSELFPDEPEEEVEESDDDYREYDNDEESAAEASFPEAEEGYAGELTGYRLSDTMRKEMYEFLLVDGMEENICNAIDSILAIKEQGDVTGGNLIITGDTKSGKTFLSVEIIKAITEAMGGGSGKVAKVQAEALNGKNIEKVFEKIADSDLIVENVGYLDDATLSDLFNNMEAGKADGMVVLEGNQLAVENIFINFPYARELFHTRLDVNELDLVQWAELGKRYAADKGYSIEGLALLAFHAKISEVNKPTVRLGYDDIRELVDKAIARAGKRRGVKKIFTPNAGGEEGGYLKQLEESDFM